MFNRDKTKKHIIKKVDEVLGTVKKNDGTFLRAIMIYMQVAYVICHGIIKILKEHPEVVKKIVGIWLDATFDAIEKTEVTAKTAGIDEEIKSVFSHTEGLQDLGIVFLKTLKIM